MLGTVTATRALLGACIALGLFAGLQTLRLSDSQAETQRVLRERAEQYAKAEAAAVEAHEHYRKREAALQAKVDEASNALQTHRAGSARTLAAVRRDADSLRNQLAAYAAGGAADDSVAACRHRADALGDVLARVLRDYAGAVASAEDRAADARALLSAWPRSSPE